MKRPNGTGSVSKLSGNRRNKYIVRKTVGVEVDFEKERTIQKQIVIGYAPTKKEALELLESYNTNPYDISSGKITFAELYERFYKSKVDSVKEATLKAYQYGYDNCEVLHSRSFADLRLGDLQKIIDESEKNFPTLKKVKTLLKLMYKYALKFDLVTKDYSEFLDLSRKQAEHDEKTEEEKHFTLEEVRTLWAHRDDDFCQSILALSWIGVRIAEFLDLKKSDVHLQERYFEVKEGKTLNAVRKVPIADIIYPYFKKWYHDGDCEYLYHNDKDMPVKYDTYLEHFKKYTESVLNNQYTCHATRHTFSSILADIDINSTVRAKLMGHSSGPITDTVYTHLDMSVLLDAVNQMEQVLDEDWTPQKKRDAILNG